MGSTARKLVGRSLMFVLFLNLGYLALPVSLAAQNYPQAVVPEQQVKEATGVMPQRQEEAARAQEQIERRQRLDRKLAILPIKAEARHAMMAKWRNAHSGEPKMKTQRGVHKNAFPLMTCL